MILLAELWERESAKGRRYYSGYLAKAKLLLLEDGPHPDRPGIVVWKLFVTENEQQERRQTPSPRYGTDRRGRYDPAPRERHDQRARAQAAGTAIVAALRSERPGEPIETEPLPDGGDPTVPW